MSEKVHIFDCGTQFMDWQVSNCERCKKSSYNDPDDDGTKWPLRCEIETDLVFAAMDDGLVTAAIKQRAGANETPGLYVWPCLEVDWTDEWIAEYEANAPR